MTTEEIEEARIRAVAEGLENERIRAEHALFVKKKGDAEEKWHEEVRKLLFTHGERLTSITNSLMELTKLIKRTDDIEARVKKLEDFKLQVVAYWTAATFLVAIIWKVIDKIWT